MEFIFWKEMSKYKRNSLLGKYRKCSCNILGDKLVVALRLSIFYIHIITHFWLTAQAVRARALAHPSLSQGRPPLSFHRPLAPSR